jgi:hypothetical protein
MFVLLCVQVIAEFNGRLSFTCVEMRDCEHPPEGRCSPQGLLQQVLECAERYGVPLAGALSASGLMVFCVLVRTAVSRASCSRCWSARSDMACHWQVRYDQFGLCMFCQMVSCV